jgi:hypothetical protein
VSENHAAHADVVHHPLNDDFLTLAAWPLAFVAGQHPVDGRADRFVIVGIDIEYGVVLAGHCARQSVLIGSGRTHHHGFSGKMTGDLSQDAGAVDTIGIRFEDQEVGNDKLVEPVLDLAESLRLRIGSSRAFTKGRR